MWTIQDQYPRRRRWLALVAVSGAAALIAGSAGSAVADEQTDSLFIASPYELPLPVADSESGNAIQRPFEVQLQHYNADNIVTGGHLTVDASGLADVAEVAWPNTCTPDSATPLTAVCDFGAIPVGWSYRSVAEIRLRAKADAVVGASGTLRMSAIADSSFGQLISDMTEVPVTIGDGPDLSLNQVPYLDGIAPGTDIDQPVRLSNFGNQPVDRTLLTFFVSHGLALKNRYGNCQYDDADQVTNPTMAAVVCVIDQPVVPGTTYDLSDAAAVRTTSAALYERFDYAVQPYSDEAYQQALRFGEFVPGSGADLTLEPMAAPLKATAPAPDLDEEDNYRTTQINVANTANLIALGDEVSGKPGDTVTATVGVKNNGPAWVASLGAGAQVAPVEVQLPEGTTAVAKPDTCHIPWTGDDDGTAEPVDTGHYVCQTPIYLWEKGRNTFTFTLRIDSVDPANAPGSVTLPDNGLEGPRISDFDPQLHNNTAPFTLVAGTG
ncbi:hypothetical protein [Streptomyces sp. NPDC001978]|uniref:hypothetical protein n=1 Tax=Streptomyces sp. NPDC001978 TaxID=3364627 RepID=UPI00368AFF4A